MGISLKPEHLKRYKDIATLLIEYGRSDLIKDTGLDAALLDDQVDGHHAVKAGVADELAKDLEAMGPTYVKLGQLLSTRADLLPEPYIDRAGRLKGNFLALADLLRGQLHPGRICEFD